jgi:hypothetical protein
MDSDLSQQGEENSNGTMRIFAPALTIKRQVLSGSVPQHLINDSWIPPYFILARRQLLGAKDRDLEPSSVQHAGHLVRNADQTPQKDGLKTNGTG